MSYVIEYKNTDQFVVGSKGVLRQRGLEPLTYCLEGSCSIQLSYWRIAYRSYVPETSKQ